MAFELNFGVLSGLNYVPKSYRGTDWSIEPLPDCETTVAEWKARADGQTNFVYPRLQETVKSFLGSKTPVPNSLRTAETQKLPATHKLVWHAGPASPKRNELEEQRKGIAGVLMHAVGVAFGIEMQFEGWEATGRVLAKPMGYFGPGHGAIDSLLQIIETNFPALPAEARLTLWNALYLHNHVPAYSWIWEQFAWQYTTFDAAWNVAVASGKVNDKNYTSHKTGKKENVKHPKRFQADRGCLRPGAGVGRSRSSLPQ